VFEALDALVLKHGKGGPPPARDGEAAEHYYRGRLAYSSGDFDRALDEFHRAYARAPAPAMLVNIGNALRKLDRPAEAIAAYHTFLDQPAGSKHLRLEVFEALDTVQKDLDHRMYQLAESVAQFQRYLDSKQGSVEVQVVMRGTVKQLLQALVRLDEQSNGRYVVDRGGNAVAERRNPRPTAY
jgi:TolA-binding protein